MKSRVDLAGFLRRLRSEAAEAATLCDRILTGPSVWWAQRLQTPRAHTTAVVQYLIERARATLNRSPEDAERMTSIAVDLAFAIEADAYPSIHLHIVQGQALRDRAYVVSYRGRRLEALELAERSQALFARYPAAAYDAARLKIVKASILQSADRVDEAIALTREAAATFLLFGDHRRHLDAKIWEGIVLYNAGAVDRALAVWKPLENDPAIDDTSRAQITHNIGLCLSDLGQHEAAAPYLRSAAAEFAGLDATRSRFAEARSSIASGSLSAAIPLLKTVITEFAAHGMIMDCALARLELAGALLLLDQPSDVPALCRDAIADFNRAGAASRATTAVAYLREAALLTPAAPALVRKASVAMRKIARGGSLVQR